MAQNESDVEVLLSDIGYMADDFYVERQQPGRKSIRIDDVDLSEDAAVSRESVCTAKFWEPTFCELYPDACLMNCGDNIGMCVGETCEDCIDVGKFEGVGFLYTSQVEGFCDNYPNYRIDCNGDGTPECCGADCRDIYEHLVVDHSVPPGETTYNVVIGTFIEDSKTITVSGGEDGCSVATVGAPQTLLAILLEIVFVY